MIDLSLLQDAKRHKIYLKGDRIIPESAIYIVVDGQIDVYQVTPDKKLIKRESAGVGMSVGERSFFGLQDFYVYMAPVDTILYEITQDTFDAIATQNPRLLYGLMQNFFVPPAFIPADPPKAAQAAATPPEKQQTEPASPASSAPVATTQTVDLFPEGHQGYPGITHPEYDRLLFEKEFSCPYCGEKFKAKKPFESKLVPDGPMRYDLRKRYQDFDMTWYDLLTCPHCYFSMFADTFVDKEKLHPRMIKEVMDGLKDRVMLDFDAPRDIDFVFATHYLALPLAEGYSNNQQILMKLWSNLSWLYEEVGDGQMERFAAQNAAQASERLYMENSKLSPVQEQLVCLCTAGMSYRAGQTDGSVMKWLFNAKTNREGKEVYADLAERLMEDIRAAEKAKQ